MSVAVLIAAQKLPEDGAFGVGLVNGLVEVRMTAISRICAEAGSEREEVCVAGVVDTVLGSSSNERDRTWLRLKLVSGSSDKEWIELTLWDEAACSCLSVRPGLAVLATKCRRTKFPRALHSSKIAGCVGYDVIIAVETATLQDMHTNWEASAVRRIVENKLNALRLRRQKQNQWQQDALANIRRDHCWLCGQSWNGASCSSFPLCAGRKSTAFLTQNEMVPALALEIVWENNRACLKAKPLKAPRGETPLDEQLLLSEQIYPLDEYEDVLKTQRDFISKGMFRGLREPPACTISTLRREALRERPAEEVEALFMRLPQQLRSFLKPFQRDGVRFCLRKRKAYLADDMGLGKTVQAIATALALKEQWPLLIICPAGVRGMWADQIERFVPEIAPSAIKVVTCSNDAPAPPPAQPPMVLIISFQMLERLPELHADAALFDFSTVIVDEAHLLTTSVSPNEAHKTTIGCAWIHTAPNVILLSGTPAMVKPISMFACLDALLPAGWLRSLKKTDRKLEFLRYWCGARPSSFGHYSRGKARFDAIKFHDELNAVLRGLCMLRRLKANVLTELPSMVRKVIRLETSKQEEDADRGKNTNFMVAGLAKLDAAGKWIVQFLEQSTYAKTKLVVFGHHISVLDGICGILEASRNKEWHGSAPGRIDGSVAASSRESIAREFRNDHEARVLVVSVTAGGVGIDLSAASHAVFLESVGLQAAWIRQAEDRLHRQGQRNCVCVYYLLGTVSDRAGWPSLYAALLSNTTVFNGAKEAERFLVDEVYEDHQDIFDPALSSTALQACHKMPLPSVTEKISDDQSDTGLEAWRWTVDDASSDEEEDESYEDNVDEKRQKLHFEVSMHSGRVHLHEAGMRLNQTVEQAELEIPRLVAKGASHWRIGARRARSAAQSILPPRLAQNGRFARDAWIFRREWRALLTRQQADLYCIPVRQPLAFALARRHTELARCRTSSSIRRYVPCLEAAFETSRGYLELPGYELIHVRVAGRDVLGLPPLPRIIHRDDHTAKCLLCPEFYKVATDAFLGSVENTLQGASKVTTTAKNVAGLFCSPECRERYKATTSSTGIRDIVYARDRGICQICRSDGHALVEQLKALSSATHGRKMSIALQSNWRWRNYQPLLKKLIDKPRDGLAWEADHVNRVADGGGEATLAHLQTLCVPCHKDKTRAENTGKLRKLSLARASAAATKKRPLESSSSSNDENTCRRTRPTITFDGDDDDELFGPNAPRPIVDQGLSVQDSALYSTDTLTVFKKKENVPCPYQLAADVDDDDLGLPDLDF